MANKSDLLKQAQRLARGLGNKLDLTELPKGRMPKQRDTKPEIEAAIAALTPAPIADPAPSPEQDTEEEQRRREKLRRKAWACWANLKEKAPDKLPEELRRMSRGYFGSILDRLMAENPDQLEKLASDLKALADKHAPLPAKQDISTIQRNFDALKGSVTFPDDLEEAGAEILAIADLSQRYDRLRIMPADMVRRLAEAFDDARMRKSLEEVSSAADDLGKRPAAHDPARPTFPSDPEDSNSNPARASNGTAGATEGDTDMNEEQLRRIVGEVLANANLVNEQTLDAKLEALRAAVVPPAGAPVGGARAWYREWRHWVNPAIVILVICVGAVSLWGGGWFSSSGTPTAPPAQQETATTLPPLMTWEEEAE